MGKKTLILLVLVAAWLYFTFGGHWHHSLIAISGSDWQVSNPLGAVLALGIGLLVAFLAIGGTLIGVVAVLLLVAGSLFCGLAFVSIPLWVPILVIWLLVRPGRRVNAG
ncbi:hypothetical protein [Gallaecimonas pentaromativorans]|uniref:Uncharacterized protein n=1 Tax=Gallaecimonas pentaromativorans TaxID=584787 RepID=A0A3N1PGD8_9GAMM|nr:hypothetical protein [Gallaecimonas pentaromativorans]MED5523341.1 hypothetical protein [Pseudomonadota bacterium]ROQ30532.1 hypothetical protein EDC28_101218 [Gallaecimonas pentaromativorans]